jgi:hypothetical protein
LAYKARGAPVDAFLTAEPVPNGYAMADNAADARAVLREVQDIVDSWLHVEPEPAQSNVLTLLRDTE